MTYVRGGQRCELFYYFNPPGTFERSFGKHRRLAQAFPVLWNTYLDYIAIKYKAGSPQVSLHVALMATDFAGAPTGPELISLVIHPSSQSYKPYTVWYGFKTEHNDIIPPATYAIIAYAPDAPDNQRYQWHSQEDVDLYPAGKCWTSNDDGLSWSELPTTDLLFEIWGRHDTDPPPQPDVISNWAVLTQFCYPTEDGVIIFCVTDIPCHLYCRITSTIPQRHLLPGRTRGATVATTIDQCFVAYTDVEQTEDGDTLTHSFNITPWAICQTRFYYFWGSKRRQLTPSASPIFSYHKTGTAGPPFVWALLLLEPWTTCGHPADFVLLLTEPWTAP
jgi:hypothetical protein